VRRSQRPKLFLTLFVTGAVPSIAVALSAHQLLHLIVRPQSLTQTSAWVLFVGLLAEVMWIGFKRLRPLSVNRQVPQSWGHDHGPWKAALRYGPRLGVGPATILTSWAWWAGLAFAAASDLYVCVVFSISFVFIRSSLTVIMPGNPIDGLELAHTMARIRNGASTMRGATVLALGIAATLTLVSARQ
jgi:hypothetical protein